MEGNTKKKNDRRRDCLKKKEKDEKIGMERPRNEAWKEGKK